MNKFNSRSLCALKPIVLALGLSAFLSANVQAASIYIQVIGNGQVLAPGEGVNMARTVGQVFIAPQSSTALLNLSFWLTSTSSMTFAAYVMEWNGDRPVGPILYASGPRTVTPVALQQCNACTASDFIRFDFSPNVTTEAGRSYIAFLSVAEYLGPSSAALGSLWSYSGNTTITTDAYPDGAVVVMTPGLGSDWSGTPWLGFPCVDGTYCVDAAFIAEFDAIIYPTPTQIANAYINSLSSKSAFSAGVRGCVMSQISQNYKAEKYGSQSGPYDEALIQQDVRNYSVVCGGPTIFGAQ
jgi:hypothetical protein